jgi:hypothetical protein
VQAAAVLRVLVDLQHARQRGGGVVHLADEGVRLEDEPEHDLAVGVLDRVRDELGDQQLAAVDQVLEAPALERVADQRPRVPDGRKLRLKLEADPVILGDAPQLGDEHRDVVAVGVGVHAVERGLAELLKVLIGRALAERGLQPVEALGDVTVPRLDKPVGVQDEERAVLDGDDLRVHHAVADAERRAGGDLQVLVAAVGVHEQRRQVPGDGELDLAGNAVVDRVRAGGEVRLPLTDGLHELVELEQRLRGRQLEHGQGLDGGAQAAHGDRGAHPVPGDVADDQGDPRARQPDRLVPVAADLNELATRQVAVLDLDGGRIGEPGGQHGPLQGERGRVLPVVPGGVVEEHR